MIRGLYTSASGMVTQLAKNDVAANNLANINTTGYKKDQAVFRSFPEMLLRRINDPDRFNPRPVVGTLGTGAVLDEVTTNWAPGSLQETGSPFHLAIAGEGYFVVDRGGRELYTRNGNFSLDRDGYLVTNNGDRVLGQRGPVRIAASYLSNGQISVDAQGGLWAKGPGGQGSVLLDSLRLVSVADPSQLVKTGDSCFQLKTGQAQAFTGSIRQGFLENANVNPVAEMVDLITVMRAYETNQKAIQAHDQTLDKAVNEVGRI